MFIWLLVVLAGVGDVGQEWPQWLGPQRDAIWRDTGILEKFPEGGLKPVWRVRIGAGYAGPAVAGGRVYVHDRSLQAGVEKPRNDFARSGLPGKESLRCLDAATGKELWRYEYDCKYDISYSAGPRCTPIVHQNKVYALGAMGDLFCLDTDTGKLLWSRSFPKEYGLESPQWGWSASPLLDGDKLICIVGGKNSVAVAFHKDTGKELWRALSAEEPGYCPPVIYTLAGKRQLIIWHPESVNGLDPETGEVYWSYPFQIQAGLSVPMPRQLPGDRLFVTAFYNGPVMLKIEAGDKQRAVHLWKGKSNSEVRTDGLHSIMPTPFIQGDHLYGICSHGQLRCLKVETGERVWETMKATEAGRMARWANAFLVQHEETKYFFIFNEKGNLIIAQLSPTGYEELDKCKLIEPSQVAQGRDIVWTHPAYAYRSIFVRNDHEIICYSLAK